jgi:hypothetical protein
MYYAVAVVVLLMHVSKSWDRISLLSLSLSPSSSLQPFRLLIININKDIESRKPSYRWRNKAEIISQETTER